MALRLVFKEGLAAAPQHQIKTVNQRIKRHHIGHIELGNQLFYAVLVGDRDRA